MGSVEAVWRANSSACHFSSNFESRWPMSRLTVSGRPMRRTKSPATTARSRRASMKVIPAPIEAGESFAERKHEHKREADP